MLGWLNAPCMVEPRKEGTVREVNGVTDTHDTFRHFIRGLEGSLMES